MHMRLNITTTVLLVQIGALLLSCGTLFVCGRAAFDDALPGLIAAVVIGALGALFTANRLAPLNKIYGYIFAVSKGDKKATLEANACGGLKPLAEAATSMVTRCEGQAGWYEGILNTLPWAISVTDMNMHWTFCNTASLKSMNKASMDEVRGLHCSEKKGNICDTPQCGIEQLRLGNKRVINHMPTAKPCKSRWISCMTHRALPSAMWKSARTSPKKSAWKKRAKQPPPRPAPPWWSNWKAWSQP